MKPISFSAGHLSGHLWAAGQRAARAEGAGREPAAGVRRVFKRTVRSGAELRRTWLSPFLRQLLGQLRGRNSSFLRSASPLVKSVPFLLLLCFLGRSSTIGCQLHVSSYTVCVNRKGHICFYDFHPEINILSGFVVFFIVSTNCSIAPFILRHISRHHLLLTFPVLPHSFQRVSNDSRFCRKMPRFTLPSIPCDTFPHIQMRYGHIVTLTFSFNIMTPGIDAMFAFHLIFSVTVSLI